MEGNKPKQQREKPVDKQSNLSNLNLNKELNIPIKSINEEDLGKEFMRPDYTSQSFYTRKQIPKAKKKKLRKIARKSRQVNRRLAKNK